MTSQKAFLSFLLGIFSVMTLRNQAEAAQLCSHALIGYQSSAGKKQWSSERLLFYKFEVPEGTQTDPVVLIGGLDSDFATTNEMAKILFDNGVPVLQVELKGQGQTLRELPSSNLKIPLNEQTEDLGNLLRELGIGDLSLMGFSYGGAVAASFAAKNSKVKKLFLVSSFYNEAEMHDSQLGMMNSMTKQYLDFFGMGEVYRHAIDSSTRIGLRMAGYTSPIKGDYLKAEGATALYDGTAQFNFNQALLTSGAQINFLHAKYDSVVPLQGVKNIYAIIPDGQRGVLEIINYFHHVLPQHQPRSVADFILKGL